MSIYIVYIIFSYTFYYEDDNDITYLCIASNIKEDVAFSFLADLKKKFLKRYEIEAIKSFYAYKLKDFNDEIRNLVKFYEENPTHTNTQLLVNSLGETTMILRESVEKLLDRNEKLNIIAQKSKNLKNTSNDLFRTV